LLPGIATATGEIVKYGIDGGEFNTGQLISDVAFDLAWGKIPGKYLYQPVSKALRESCKYKSLGISSLFVFTNYYKCHY